MSPRPVRKQRTFRCEDPLWADFIAATERNETTASDVLRAAVVNYVSAVSIEPRIVTLNTADLVRANRAAADYIAEYPLGWSVANAVQVGITAYVATEPERIRLARQAAVLQERARVALFETARACDHCNAKTGQWVEHERHCPEAPEDEW